MRSRFRLAFAVIVFAAMLAACGGGGPPKPVPPPPEPTPTPPSSTVTQGDWYTYRHDTQRTGRSGVVGPQNPQILFSVPGDSFIEPVFDSENTAYLAYGDIPRTLGAVRDGELLWAQEPGEGDRDDYDCVSVGADGKLYTDVSDGGYYVRSYSLDGELLWSFETEISWTWVTPGADDNLYIAAWMSASSELGLYCISPEGSLRWVAPTGRAEFFEWMSIAPDGGLLATLWFGFTVESEQPTVMRIDSTNGDVLWETPMLFEQPFGWGYAPSVPVIADDGTIYVADIVGVYAFSPQGDVLWSYYPGGQDIEHPTGPTPWGEEWPPTLGPEGNVYLTLMEEMETYVTALIALNSSGVLLWRRDEYFEGPPIVDAAGTVYVGSGYGEPGNPLIPYGVSQVEDMEPRNSVLAINPNGTTKWEFSAPNEFEVAKVLCMDNEGNLVVSGRNPDGDPWEERLFWIGDAQ